MLALIDGDILLYRCGFAIEKSSYIIYKKGREQDGPVVWFEKKRAIPDEYKTDQYVIEQFKHIEPLENALHATNEAIQSIITNSGSTGHHTYLSGDTNFRDAIAVTRPYKGNRDPSHKPHWFKDIREHLIRRWGAEVVEGIEADDAIATAQMKQLHIPEHDGDTGYANSVICTIDKDLDQIPGWHYNFVTKERYWVSDEEGIRNFYMQLLTGDRVDNIQGVPGIGPKRAADMLSGCKTERDMYNVCYQAYHDLYGSAHRDTVLKEMADLLYIRKHPNDEWKPPSELRVRDVLDDPYHD